MGDEAFSNPLSEGFVTLTKSCVGVAKKADVSSNFWSQPRTSAAAITGIGLKQWMEEVKKSGLELEQYSGEKCRMQRPITKATGAMRPLDEKPEKYPHRAGRGLPAFVRNGGSQAHRKSNAELTLEMLPALEQDLLAHAHAHYGTDRDLPNDITRTCQLARVPLEVAAAALVAEARRPSRWWRRVRSATISVCSTDSLRRASCS